MAGGTFVSAWNANVRPRSAERAGAAGDRGVDRAPADTKVPFSGSRRAVRMPARRMG